MEIYIDILRVVDDRTKPTHIMYRANLNWERLEKHVDFLSKQNLLKKMYLDGKVTFSITPKGKNVIDYFERFEGELHSLKKTLLPEVYDPYKKQTNVLLR